MGPIGFDRFEIKQLNFELMLGITPQAVIDNLVEFYKCHMMPFRLYGAMLFHV